MKRARILLLFVLCIVCISLRIYPVYCQAPQEEAASPQDISAAKESLDRLIKPYKDRDKDFFMDQLSREFHPGYSTMESTISSNFEDYTDIDLTYDVTGEYKQGDYVVLEVRWRKIWTSVADKSYKKETGYATFTFIKAYGEYKLFDLSGDNPF